MCHARRGPSARRIALALVSSAAWLLPPPAPASSPQARAAPTDRRGMFVSVLDKDGAPVAAGRRPTSSSARTAAREVLRAGRRPIRSRRRAHRQQPGGHAVHRRHPAGARAVRQAAWPASNPIALIGVRRAPDVLTDYTPTTPRLKKGDRAHLPDRGQRRLPARRHRRDREGAQEARARTRRHRGDHGRRAASSATASYDEFILTAARQRRRASTSMIIGTDAARLSDDGQRNREHVHRRRDAGDRGATRCTCSAAWRSPAR